MSSIIYAHMCILPTRNRLVGLLKEQAASHYMSLLKIKEFSYIARPKRSNNQGQ